MGKLTAGADTLSVTVLDSSALTNPSGTVLHPLINGGLPKATARMSAGLSGTLELLCPDAATAWDVYAAHLNGQRVHLDESLRTNQVPDPRLTTATWGQGLSTGTLTHATADGPNGRGYFQYELATDAGEDFMSVAPAGFGADGAAAVTPGEPFTASAYWWESVSTGTHNITIGWRNAAGGSLGLEEADPVPAGPAGEWSRSSAVFTPPAGAVFARVQLSMDGFHLAGETLRVADVLLEYGSELRDWFDGDTVDGEHVYAWDGPPEASTSRQYGTAALAFWYVNTGGPDIPHRRGNHWLVRVSGVQEVAAP